MTACWSVARLAIAVCSVFLAEQATGQDRDDVGVQGRATVGSIGRISDLVLPGSLMQAKPIEDRNLPLVVRVVETYPHGDSHRYELSFMALEPGRYDLREYLQRVDGSQVGELPAIGVEITSVLAPGHVPPHQLVSSWPQVGTYRFWALLVLAAWVISLIAILFWPKQRSIEPRAAPATTLADLLRPRLTAAAAGELNHRQLAELERWVVEFWRRRLGLMGTAPKDALLQLRRHEQSGPLLQQLERWLHSPQRDGTLSLGELLLPYQELAIPDGSEDALVLNENGPPSGQAGGPA